MNELPKWLIHYLYNQLNFLAIFAPLREQMPFLINNNSLKSSPQTMTVRKIVICPTS